MITHLHDMDICPFFRKLQSVEGHPLDNKIITIIDCTGT